MHMSLLTYTVLIMRVSAFSFSTQGWKMHPISDTLVYKNLNEWIKTYEKNDAERIHAKQMLMRMKTCEETFHIGLLYEKECRAILQLTNFVHGADVESRIMTVRGIATMKDDPHALAHAVRFLTAPNHSQFSLG
eukprot:5242574-Pleurochrysis_carterae.AAC.1